MSSAPETAGFALLCLPNGSIAEVLYDRLGLKPGRDFMSMIRASSLHEAKRFLRAAITGCPVLDCELAIEMANGVVPMFLSATSTSRGLLLVGMKTPLSSTAALPRPLVQLASSDSELAPALKELTAWREPKALPRQRPGSKPENSTGGLRLADPQGANTKTAGGGKTNQRRMLFHDLMNPLSGILVASQYLIEDAASLLDNQQMSLLQSIESSSILMLRMIDDKLEAPRARSGKLRLQLQPVDVTWLVEQIAAILQRIPRANNTRLEVTKDEGVASMLLDPLKMTRALTGVLTAVHSSSGEDVEVVIKAHPKRVVVTVSHKTPTGVSEEARHRSGSSRRRNQEQNPRPLASARRIVEAHGGGIKIQNSARRSVFILTLPRARRGNAEPHEGGEPSTTRFRNSAGQD